LGQRPYVVGQEKDRWLRAALSEIGAMAAMTGEDMAIRGRVSSTGAANTSDDDAVATMTAVKAT